MRCGDKKDGTVLIYTKINSKTMSQKRQGVFDHLIFSSVIDRIMKNRTSNLLTQPQFVLSLQLFKIKINILLKYFK